MRTARRWTAEEVLDRLERSDVFVERSLLYLNGEQTEDERKNHTTIEANGVGFNAFDAEFLTSLAEQVEDSSYPEGRRLSRRQRDVARKRLRKYVRQLVERANR